MLMYYMPFFDGSNHYSVDNVRLDLEFLSPDQCQWFLDQISKLDGYTYYNSLKDFAYAFLGGCTVVVECAAVGLITHQAS